jgi:uncharacterized SAM-binding protein YcdF (DUF218 family)
MRSGSEEANNLQLQLHYSREVLFDIYCYAIAIRMLAIARILLSGSIWQQIACLFFCALIVYALQRVAASNSAKFRLPPIEKGWMPWLGVAITFGKNPM